MNRNYTLLHVDDDASMLRIVSQILGEKDFFFAFERARATDLLKVGFEWPSLTTGVEFFGRDDGSGTRHRLPILYLRSRYNLFFGFQLLTLSACRCASNSSVGYRPNLAGS